MQYNITRLETYSDKTFVRIDTDKPVYIEKFILAGDSVEDAIADMIVELQDRYDSYVAPEAPVIASDEDRAALQASITPNVLAAAEDRASKVNTEPPTPKPVDNVL